MGLKNNIELQFNKFQQVYNSLDSSAEDYDAQLAKLQSDYNLNLDANQITNSKGVGPLSLDDADSVRKRMLLNAKRDRRYARQENLRNAVSGIASEGINQIGNIVQALNQQQPNLQEPVIKTNPMKPVIGNITLNDFRNGSTFSTLAKQGIKIEYMNLFK